MKKREERKALPLKERVRAVANKVNKFNPATALLRAGVLASKKLNVFKVGNIMRFAYWTTEQARLNEMDMAKYNALQVIRKKFENTYYGARGNAAALKQAIISGRGNQDRQVSLNGLGAVASPVYDENSLQTILGTALLNAEVSDFEAFNGLGSLGEPLTTTAAVTAASGVIAGLSRQLKKLGSLFKRGSRGEKAFLVQDKADDVSQKTRKFSLKNSTTKIKSKIQERKAKKAQGKENELTAEEEPILGEDLVLEEADFEIAIDNGDTF